MVKRKKKKESHLEKLIPDKEKRDEVLFRLYNGDPILGDGGIFTDMLQSIVNAALEGEIDHSLQDKLPGDTNRRNGHTRKVVRSVAGPIEVQTPRDRTGES